MFRTCANLLRSSVGGLFTSPAYRNLSTGFMSNINVTSMVTKTPFLSSSSPFPALSASGAGDLVRSQTTGVILNQIRTNIRNNWPRPRESKRRSLGWKHRMSTPGGRRVLMRRILKGRHCLSH